MSFDLLSSTTQTASEALIRIRPYQDYLLNTAATCTAVWILLRWLHNSRQKVRTTKLRGPPSESFLYGVGRHVLDAEDKGSVYEAWAREYGPVYVVPTSLGKNRVILCDPKAIAHFFAKETWTYVLPAMNKQRRAHFLGKGLLWAEGEDHKRQRRSLTPAFSIAAIRQLTPIFYDSAYKTKAAWDALIESTNRDSAIIDVESWMNHVSLDTIGLAGFSHDFGALEGKHTPVADDFDAFSETRRPSALNKALFLLAEVFPFLILLPTSRAKLGKRLSGEMEEISTALLTRTRREMEMGVLGGKEEKSIIGLLIKAANTDSAFPLTKEEVLAQMKVLLLAGYETSSITMTWALVELCRNQDVQTKLRNELLDYSADPSYDQLTNGLPYLDAVIHETLRLHPPFAEATRVAAEDDVIPVSQSIRTTSGELVESLTISKGTQVTVSMESINRSAAIWGEDAKMFKPSRWLEEDTVGIPAKAKEVQGYRHLLTFVDGPRTCLGKQFAVTEMKVIMGVLIKNFVFELRDGVDSKIEVGRGMLPRPKVAGEVGCKSPLRVRLYVG